MAAALYAAHLGRSNFTATFIFTPKTYKGYSHVSYVISTGIRKDVTKNIEPQMLRVTRDEHYINIYITFKFI